jgi:hypothetical protein
MEHCNHSRSRAELPNSCNLVTARLEVATHYRNTGSPIAAPTHSEQEFTGNSAMPRILPLGTLI